MGPGPSVSTKGFRVEFSGKFFFFKKFWPPGSQIPKALALSIIQPGYKIVNVSTIISQILLMH